jgi:hypothetical protein
VDDDGVFRGASLGGKNAADGACVQRIGGQAINGLGGQDDDFAGLKEFGRARDGFVK